LNDFAKSIISTNRQILYPPIFVLIWYLDDLGEAEQAPPYDLVIRDGFTA